MADLLLDDAFTLVRGAQHDAVFEDFKNHGSAKWTNATLSVLTSLRQHHPDMTVTINVSPFHPYDLTHIPKSQSFWC